ncbi:hypothetical protein ACKTEK_11710 [Tepidamorphus sp. 3E244]|uniref:hypothetical protein n=1 Tax=Tepidamorphus sp. 3E244 TaxID=3385498 RepID=UPI0038FCC3C2
MSNDDIKREDGQKTPDTGSERSRDISKRDLIKKAAWVAPVIVSVKLPNTVYAQSAVSPVAPGSPSTTAPTTGPTAAPTTAPAAAVPSTST